MPTVNDATNRVRHHGLAQVDWLEWFVSSSLVFLFCTYLNFFSSVVVTHFIRHFSYVNLYILFILFCAKKMG